MSLKPIRLIERYAAIVDRAEDVQENVEGTLQGESVSTHRERREETLLSEKDEPAKEEKLEREIAGKIPNRKVGGQ